ncbi:MAG: hypothetical protein AB1736_02415 [Chloroflexota bacterium]
MTRLLLRLYPARWRARYGDEFELLLRERPLGPFDVADVLLGALDAQLHLRGPGAASTHGKGFAMTLRIGGLAAILGGLLWFLVLVGNAVNDGRESGATWLGPLILAAVVATLIALVGLSAFQARRYPMLIWGAFAIPALGAVVTLLGATAMAVAGSTDREVIAGLSGWIISTIGVMSLLLGSGLFAVATWRTRSLSRAAAALLAIGAIVTLPGIGVASSGVVSREIAGLAILATVTAFPAGWAALGISALRLDRAATARIQGATS